MAKRNVRIRAVRRGTADIEKLVSGLLLLLEELAETSDIEGGSEAAGAEEADR